MWVPTKQWVRGSPGGKLWFTDEHTEPLDHLLPFHRHHRQHFHIQLCLTMILRTGGVQQVRDHHFAQGARDALEVSFPESVNTAKSHIEKHEKYRTTSKCCRISNRSDKKLNMGKIWGRVAQVILVLIDWSQIRVSLAVLCLHQSAICSTLVR